MSLQKIWLSDDLRMLWQEVVSEKTVDFFEKFVQAENAEQFKIKSQHAKDSGVPSKYVSRAAERLHQYGLLSLENNGERFRFKFNIPISEKPPENVKRENWETDNRTATSISQSLKKQIYELDNGHCAYCEEIVELKEAVVDHIYPNGKSGADSIDNLTIACAFCNRKKWSRTPADPKYLSPKRFRNKTVALVSFKKIGKYYHPKFTFEE